MKEKAIIKSQYGASLEMLRQAISKCPDSLWHGPEYQNQFWQIAYHTIFYAHLYLHATEADFVPWKLHRRELARFEAAGIATEQESLYSKDEMLDYLALCLEQMPGHVDALDLQAGSGFEWLPFNKLELQFYNIRHIQQHTGELCERLGAVGGIEIAWVGMIEG